jgi:hypothetical protein
VAAEGDLGPERCAPARRAGDLERAVEHREAIRQTAQAISQTSLCATNTVIAHLYTQQFALDPHRHFGTSCTSMLDDVRQRFADDVIGGRIHAGR